MKRIWRNHCVYVSSTDSKSPCEHGRSLCMELDNKHSRKNFHHNHRTIGIIIVSEITFGVKLICDHLHIRHFCLNMKLLSVIGLILPPPSANSNLSEPNIPRYLTIIHSVFVYICVNICLHICLYICSLYLIIRHVMH